MPPPPPCRPPGCLCLFLSCTPGPVTGGGALGAADETDVQRVKEARRWAQGPSWHTMQLTSSPPSPPPPPRSAHTPHVSLCVSQAMSDKLDALSAADESDVQRAREAKEHETYINANIGLAGNQHTSPPHHLTPPCCHTHPANVSPQ